VQKPQPKPKGGTMKKQDYLAEGNRGSRHYLYRTAHPRKALLEACNRKSAAKVYVDHKDNGKVMHVGYIVGGEWFTVLIVKPFKEWE
jgi:hypothetical protein